MYHTGDNQSIVLEISTLYIICLHNSFDRVFIDLISSALSCNDAQYGVVESVAEWLELITGV